MGRSLAEIVAAVQIAQGAADGAKTQQAAEEVIALRVAALLLKAADAMAANEVPGAPQESEGAPATPSATVGYIGRALTAYLTQNSAE